MRESPSPTPSFPVLAAVFEGGVAVTAIALGWVLGQPPLATLSVDSPGVFWGLAAVAPPLVLLWLCLWVPVPPFSHVLRAVDELLTPMFKSCGVIEMAVIAVLAGLGEEMLFRGVFQAKAADWAAHILPVNQTFLGGNATGWFAAVLVAVLFGLLHAVNWSYALLAGVIGLYFGWLWMVTGNLMIPVAAHALYDFLALLYLVKIRGPCLESRYPP